MFGFCINHNYDLSATYTQGDLCRTFRRTVELLRQIPQAYGVSAEMAEAATLAVKKMNRFPIADIDTDPIDPAAVISTASGTGFGNFEGNVDDTKDPDEGSLLMREAALFSGDDDEADQEDGDDEDVSLEERLGLQQTPLLDLEDDEAMGPLETALDGGERAIVERQKEYDNIIKSIESKYNLPDSSSSYSSSILDGNNKKYTNQPIKAPTTPRYRYRDVKTRDRRTSSSSPSPGSIRGEGEGLAGTADEVFGPEFNEILNKVVNEQNIKRKDK